MARMPELRNGEDAPSGLLPEVSEKKRQGLLFVTLLQIFGSKE
jgi:hypothetical protein